MGTCAVHCNGRQPQRPPAVSARPLDVLETLFAVGHEVTGTFVVVTVAELDPPVSRDALAEAGKALQKLQPMLRTALRFKDDLVLLDMEAGGDVETREFTCPVMEATEVELMERLPVDVCGWRLGTCGKHILLTYHHAFLDGRSVMSMLEDLLILLDGDIPQASPMRGLTLPPSADLPFYASPLEMGPPEDHVVPDPAVRASVGLRQTKQLWHQFSPETTAATIGRCRAERTTVQGLLGASGCRAMTRQLEGLPGLMVSTTVDIRGHCRRDPRTLGNHVGSVSAVLRADKPRWELARHYKAELSSGIARNMHLSGAVLWRFHGYHMLRERLQHELLYDDGFETSSALCISNRGSFQLATAKRRVTSVFWSTRNVGLGYFGINAVTVGGSLCITVTYNWPCCTDAYAEEFMRFLVAELSEEEEVTVGGSKKKSGKSPK